MNKLIASVALVACFTGVASADMFNPNCTANKERPLACYSCLGRDFLNCNWGLTCCKGSCFKLIDTKHQLIVKGCVSKEEKDRSMTYREDLPIRLYWANDERVEGEAYYCNKGDRCNAATTVSSVATIGFSVLLARLFH